MKKSLADFTEAIQINPSPIAYVMRGDAYGEKGEWDKAIADFNNAINRGLNHAEIYNSRGLAYGKKGDKAKAEADFVQASLQGPHYC